MALHDCTQEHAYITSHHLYDCVEKGDLSKGYQNTKRKLGVTTYFSEITELKFGKKISYILCILSLILELWLLKYV